MYHARAPPLAHRTVPANRKQRKKAAQLDSMGQPDACLKQDVRASSVSSMSMATATSTGTPGSGRRMSRRQRKAAAAAAKAVHLCSTRHPLRGSQDTCTAGGGYGAPAAAAPGSRSGGGRRWRVLDVPKHLQRKRAYRRAVEELELRALGLWVDSGCGDGG